MQPLTSLSNCCRSVIARIAERRWTLVLLLLLTLFGFLCGVLFLKTPAFYEFHLRNCAKFLDRVCASDRSVFLTALEHAAGYALLLALYLLGGVHIAALLLPSVAIVFRAYTFGGTVAILFSVYRLPGALVFFLLYLPIRLLTGALLLIAAALSFSRAISCKFSSAEFRCMLSDFGILAAGGAIVCILEAILLAIFFHPLGNLL